MSKGMRRFAVYLDLENLTHEFMLVRDWQACHQAISEVLGCFSVRGTLLVKVAACNPWLAGKLRAVTRSWGIEVLVHKGGCNAADLLLIDRINYGLPKGCDTVVIGSGDSIFVDSARQLKLAGKRVEAIYPSGRISTDLYATLDAHHAMPRPSERLLRKLHGDYPLGLRYGGAVSSRLYRRMVEGLSEQPQQYEQTRQGGQGRGSARIPPASPFLLALDPEFTHPAVISETLPGPSSGRSGTPGSHLRPSTWG